MAGTTGLEPATSDVTGRRSNQLNYVPAMSGGRPRITQDLRRRRHFPNHQYPYFLITLSQMQFLPPRPRISGSSPRLCFNLE